MTRIAWNAGGSRFFEAGVDRGVLYVDGLAGLPWIGLISVEENPANVEPTPYYIDGIKYLNIAPNGEFEATIKAYTYPVEFADCDGTARIRSGLFFGQQRRKPFDFAYRTLVGDEISGVNLGYKLHLVYGALATPSTKSASTFDSSIAVSDFSWSITTKPRFVPGYGRTAHVVVDSRYINEVALSEIEDILYGNEMGVARMPSPEELITIFDTPIEWTVTDNGNETYLVGGPEDNVSQIEPGKFVLTHPSIVDSGDTFTITY